MFRLLTGGRRRRLIAGLALAIYNKSAPVSANTSRGKRERNAGLNSLSSFTMVKTSMGVDRMRSCGVAREVREYVSGTKVVDHSRLHVWIEYCVWWWVVDGPGA